MAVSLVFPHQLFHDHPALIQGVTVWLIEEPLFFTHFPFHKQKLLLHRATMKMYEEYLQAHDFDVTYFEFGSSATSEIFKKLKKAGHQEVHLCDVTDYLLRRRIVRYAKQEKIEIHWYESPNFMNTRKEYEDYFKGKKRYFLTDYYIHQRKKYQLMVDSDDKPFGGQWTYDTENRKKIPAGTPIPPLPMQSWNPYTSEAKTYVEKHFAHNPGKTDRFVYPITFEESEKWLEEFCTTRFHHYGVYQDAIVKQQRFLFHAILTPMLNVGILNPGQVVSKAIEIGMRENVPLNSLEGFVRQILGWREYIRAVYELRGVEERTKNYWNHRRKIPASFWNGTTGIEPIDAMIRRMEDDGYAHHIERLMIAGNFMVLCEFDPDEVYHWFMSLFIDSYDWVMVPNVYGMSQYADGGLMSTKPYISGSNYVLKMSDYSKGPWCEIWDALFWRFIGVHRDFFLKNPRLSMMARTWDKMSADKQQGILDKAESYLKSLDA